MNFATLFLKAYLIIKNMLINLQKNNQVLLAFDQLLKYKGTLSYIPEQIKTCGGEYKNENFIIALTFSSIFVSELLP